MDELHRVMRETVDPHADEAIRAAAFALADVQAELISTLLAEKALSANALQRMLNDLSTRAHRQPPLNRGGEAETPVCASDRSAPSTAGRLVKRTPKAPDRQPPRSCLRLGT